MFFYSRIPPHVFRPKKDAKEMTVFLFTIIILTLFTLGVTLIDRSKLLQVRAIKVTPSAIKVTPFGAVGNLIGL